MTLSEDTIRISLGFGGIYRIVCDIIYSARDMAFRGISTTSLTTTGVALKILSYTCDIYLLFDEDLIFIFPNFPMEAVIGTNDIYLPVQLLQETFSCSWVTLSFCFPTKLDFLCSRTKQLQQDLGAEASTLANLGTRCFIYCTGFAYYMSADEVFDIGTYQLVLFLVDASWGSQGVTGLLVVCSVSENILLGFVECYLKIIEISLPHDWPTSDYFIFWDYAPLRQIFKIISATVLIFSSSVLPLLTDWLKGGSDMTFLVLHASMAPPLVNLLDYVEANLANIQIISAVIHASMLPFKSDSVFILEITGNIFLTFTVLFQVMSISYNIQNHIQTCLETIMPDLQFNFFKAPIHLNFLRCLMSHPPSISGLTAVILVQSRILYTLQDATVSYIFSDWIKGGFLCSDIFYRFATLYVFTFVTQWYSDFTRNGITLLISPRIADIHCLSRCYSFETR